jgi:hypothetical protein
VSSRSARLLLILLVAGACLVGAEPAHAETIRVPWPIWVLIEGWYLLLWLLSAIWWLFLQLWTLVIAGFNAFWVFVLFVVFVPLPKLILGVVVTLGGAFLPEIGLPGKGRQANSGTIEVTSQKLLVRGAPRYAVCLIGILIVASSVWQYTTP